jgi:xylulokinase
MSANLLLGVDIGTQGTKTILYTSEGQCLARAFASSKLHRPGEGMVEEDPEDQVNSVCSGIRKCLRRAGAAAGNVAAVAIAGQMAGVIGIGSDGRNVTPYDSWLDTRCAPQIKKMKERADAEIVQKTGGPASFNHGPKILRWKEEYPDIYRNIVSFVQPGAYAAMRLCGLDAKSAFIDKTYLHFSGFTDSQNGRWDSKLCESFGISEQKLPRIVFSHEVIGNVSGAMAKRCGLKPGTPVVAGCGDTSASFLACGATVEGICVDVAGTASVFAATTSRFCADLETQTLSCSHSATPGLWHLYAYVNGGGMNLEWFCKTILGERNFAKMDEGAEAIPLSDDLPMFVPHLGGRVSPSQPELRGAWVGLNWSQRKYALYRAVLEGVALEYGIYREILQSLDRNFQIKEVRVTGGGERSKFWNRMKAGVLGSPVTQIAKGEGAPCGAALLAGFGIGLFPDLGVAAQKWIELGGTIKPLPTEVEFFSRRLSRYRSLLSLLSAWSQQ